jgi:hypothetical protein
MAKSRRFSSCLLLSGGSFLAACAFGQASNHRPVTVCQLLTEPAQYSGKQVTVRAEMIDPKRVQLVDPSDAKCGRIPWMYPTSPDIKPKPKFALVRDSKFKELLDSFGLMLPPPTGSTRQKSRIVAVLEGRFDSVYRLENGRPVRSAKGIGYLGADDHVFVLHRVVKTEILPANRHDARPMDAPAKQLKQGSGRQYKAGFESAPK